MKRIEELQRKHLFINSQQIHHITTIINIMAWLLRSSEEDTKKAPTRSSRQKCWDSRDKYFSCLDKLQIDNALDDSKQKEINSNCSTEIKDFDANCAKSWVKYFKEQRFYAIKKERFMKEMEERGGTEIPIGRPSK